MNSDIDQFRIMEGANTLMEALLEAPDLPTDDSMRLVRESVDLENPYSRQLYIELEEAINECKSIRDMVPDYQSLQKDYIAMLADLLASMDKLDAFVAAADSEIPGFKVWADATLDVNTRVYI
jgi:hypothetical protein